jgi:hypothetical protein
MVGSLPCDLSKNTRRGEVSIEKKKIKLAGLFCLPAYYSMPLSPADKPADAVLL